MRGRVFADSLKVQRALIVDALAEAMRAARAGRRGAFAHPLAITDAARRRFNIGPMTPPPHAGGPFAITSDPDDWDRSTAMNAPGQSGSPDSAHFVISPGGGLPVSSPARVHRRRGTGGHGVHTHADRSDADKAPHQNVCVAACHWNSARLGGRTQTRDGLSPATSQ